MEAVGPGDQAESGNAHVFTANSSLSLTQFELYFFFFFLSSLMEYGSVQTITLTILLQEKH